MFCRHAEACFYVIYRTVRTRSLAMQRHLDFNLGGIVPPWGRNSSEREMFFALTDAPRHGF